MNYDSFISPQHTATNAFTRWWRWSLVLALGTVSTLSVIHIRMARAYAEQREHCNHCEKNTTKAQPLHHEQKAVSQEYAALAEQINAVHEYLADKARMATLANDLLKGTHAPVVLQSATLTARDCSLIFRCPPTYAVHTLTDRLGHNHPQLSFRAARLEQREDALLVTINAASAITTTPENRNQALTNKLKTAIL